MKTGQVDTGKGNHAWWGDQPYRSLGYFREWHMIKARFASLESREESSTPADMRERGGCWLILTPPSARTISSARPRTNSPRSDPSSASGHPQARHESVAEWRLRVFGNPEASNKRSNERIHLSFTVTCLIVPLNLNGRRSK